MVSSRTLVVLAVLCASAAVDCSRWRGASVNVDPHEDGEGYNVEVDGQKLNLRKPAGPSMAFDFSFTVLDTNEDGEPEFKDRTEAANSKPHPVFVDEENNSVVEIHEKNGTYRIHGIIDNMRIKHHENENAHKVIPIKEDQPSKSVRDYVDLNLKLVPRPQSRAGITTANPEVYVIFDYSNSQQFNFDEAKIKNYLSVFFYSINQVYARIADPKIQFVVSGVLAVKSQAAQPFMTAGKINGANAYDMDKVLTSLSSWIVTNKASIPPHDATALISGEKWMAADNGVYKEGIAGLAYVGGFCLTEANTAEGKRSLGSSVNADKGGYWAGVMTVAHELAHNLNSPHDGDGTSGGCPWSQGYIMSYQGWGTKAKFSFSPCTINNMKTFINSKNGACLTTYASQAAQRLALTAPTKVLTMDEQCQKAMGNTGAKAYKPANIPESDVCLQLICREPEKADGSFSYSSRGQLPLENTPCAKGKTCKGGDCK